MKVGHFNTAFRASLLLFVAFSSSVALADGTCYLTQYPSGEYVIRCEGDGIWINYVDRTNEVYIIENCETLKANLLFAVDYIADYFTWSMDKASEIETVSNYLIDGLTDETDPNGHVYDGLWTIRGDSVEIQENLILARDSLIGTSTSDEGSLRRQILDIQCGSCSTNSSGGGSCCDVDLTPILQQLNMANSTLQSVTNSLGSLGIYVGGNTNFRFWRYQVNSVGNKETISQSNQSLATSNIQRNNIINVLNLMHQNLAQTQASINNYLHHFVFSQMPNVSNNLEIVMSTTTNFYNAATNHFSFFRDITFQDSPLMDYSQQSTFDNYYDFLTNHYVKVSFRQYNDLVGDEKSKTNWFSRIETLLAALVFNDVEGTNTVDDTFGQSQQDNLINSLDGMNQTSTTQVNLMSNMGDSLLASLRSLNSSFSSAVSMPGEVKLATIGQDNSTQSNIIKFQSSEISQLVEACRCATTLAWCFGGIWLLFLFVSWSVKTSYSLCVFAWSVVSAIFGGGKT